MHTSLHHLYKYSKMHIAHNELSVSALYMYMYCDLSFCNPHFIYFFKIVSFLVVEQLTCFILLWC